MPEKVQLTESQIDEIASKAAEKAIAKMTGQLYQEVGKTVVKKFFWFVGLLAVGVIAGWQAAGKLFN
jgi:hypothetical protein